LKKRVIDLLLVNLLKNYQTKSQLPGCGSLDWFEPFFEQGERGFLGAACWNEKGEICPDTLYNPYSRLVLGQP
jgi:hypothetical protein